MHRRKTGDHKMIVMQRDCRGIAAVKRRTFRQLGVLALIASQTCASFTGVNLRRQPFDYEETERSALGDEIDTKIDRAPLRTFSDPQHKSSTVTSNIPASQQVLVSCKFENKWTESSHPVDYPPNAHWSPVVLVSHSNQYHMWSYGDMAGRGVEEVAEVRRNIMVRYGESHNNTERPTVIFPYRLEIQGLLLQN